MTKLLLEKDIPYDVSQFRSFLDPKRSDASYRFRILEKYPELASLNSSTKEGFEVLYSFTSKLYELHNTAVTQTLQEGNRIIDELFPKSLEALTTSMTYHGALPERYRAVLSFLPMFPFDYQTNTFCVDALAHNPIQIIETAIHEISHFFYFDFLLSENYAEFVQSNSWEKYVAKEAITPIIMRNGELQTIFGKEFRANKNVSLLQYSPSETLVDYFERIFFRETTDFLSFARLVTEFSIEHKEVLRERKLHWDRAHTMGISDEQRNDAFLKMKEPIV